ncbi:MAG: hypothetical protein F6K26_52270 [Moorea sp. SIO2I5]|nr:hypothetical protein [Moorena sp. SIO2I5]
MVKAMLLWSRYGIDLWSRTGLTFGHATRCSFGAATRTHPPSILNSSVSSRFPIPDSRLPIPENCQFSFYPLN